MRILPLHPALGLLKSSPLLLLSLVTWAGSGCSVNPVSRLPEVTLITVEQEKKLGADEAVKVEQQMGLLEDPALVSYVESVGQRLAEQSPRRDVAYRFHVVDMVEPNAFALPGGYVYVTRGLLALVNTEDELAGVVGHEIGHVAARHSVQKISRQGPFAVVTGIVAGVTGLVSPLVGNIVGGVGEFAQSLVFSPYSRSQENEADKVGQEMAAKAGWEPEGLTDFLNTLGREEALVHDGPRRPSFFDSHPATPDRVANTSKHAKQLQRAVRELTSTGDGQVSEAACTSGWVRFLAATFSPRVATAKQVAASLGVCCSTLTSRFYRAGLPSPKCYVAHARLVWAARLGETPGLPISAIADRLDASSPQSFGRTVRTMLGVTAADFRRTFDGEAMLARFRAELVEPYRETLRTFDPLTVSQAEREEISRKRSARRGLTVAGRAA